MSIAEKLTKVAENVPKVYKAGQQSECDRFWDAFQDNGDVVQGAYLFSGRAWTDAVYNPKYPVRVTNCTNMYRGCLITDTKVDIDFSNATGTYAFNDAANLINIRKLIVNKNVAYTGWFAYCSALEEIRFEGKIGKSLDIHYSTKLSYDSVANIFECLGGTDSATLTLPTSHNDGRYASLIADIPSNWAVSWL